MKLSDVKFYHSVKIGNEEVQTAQNRPSFNGKKIYEMELIGELIKITDGVDTTYSSLSNAIWFKVIEAPNGRNEPIESAKHPKEIGPITSDKRRR
jgi:hypothetical protein